MTAGYVPADLWPKLSVRFGLHPRDEKLPPEQGGLTYEQIGAYIAALEDVPYVGAVTLVDPPS